MELDHVLIRGAREHNLRGIDVRIPKKQLVVLTGVSGSGKSSLAFDTLYAEGQRRYVESLSAYARQFLGQMEKPRYDTIRGLSPTISIEQKTTGTNPRSTVGTITEISDYLRVLYAGSRCWPRSWSTGRESTGSCWPKRGAPDSRACGWTGRSGRATSSNPSTSGRSTPSRRWSTGWWCEAGSPRG
jgi:hypothetical protein